MHNATIQPIRLSIRESTLRITGERNWRNANNAIILQLGQTVWSTTKGTHSGEKPHRCTTCEFFSNQSIEWMMRKHTGENPFKCNQCRFTATYSGNLKTHSIIHTGEKPHKCNQCNYSANLVSNLRVHIWRHTGEKPHQCNQCDYATITSGDLKKHKIDPSWEKPHRCTTVFQHYKKGVENSHYGEAHRRNAFQV